MRIPLDSECAEQRDATNKDEGFIENKYQLLIKGGQSPGSTGLALGVREGELFALADT